MVKRFQFIRKNRKRKKLTIEQLAEKADVSIDLVARLERGEREDVSISKLESILHALDLELGDVFKHSKLDKKSDEFVRKFLKLDAETREKYTDIFLSIIDLKKWINVNLSISCIGLHKNEALVTSNRYFRYFSLNYHQFL